MKQGIIPFCLFVLVFTTGCTDGGRGSSNLKKGNYYSFNASGNGYKVAKIFMIENDIVHLCYYNNLFQKRPAPSDVSELRFGKWTEMFKGYAEVQDGKTTIGRKHLAINKKHLADWDLKYLAEGSVKPDEADLVKKWQSGEKQMFNGRPNQ